MRDVMHRVWRHLAPPHGLQVRRVLVLLALAISLPRLFQPKGPMFILPRLPMGVAFLALAILLALTCYRWRLQWPGRLTGVLGFAMFATLAWDAWAVSKVSAAMSIAIAYVLLGETSGHEP